MTELKDLGLGGLAITANDVQIGDKVLVKNWHTANSQFDKSKTKLVLEVQHKGAPREIILNKQSQIAIETRLGGKLEDWISKEVQVISKQPVMVAGEVRQMILWG